MVSGCKALISIDVSGFNTSNVINMNATFNDCNNLTSLDLSSFNTQNVTSMINMLRNCNKLKTLKLGADFEFQSDCNLMDYASPWVKQGTLSPIYTSTELMSIYDGSTMSGTYVRICIAWIKFNKDDQVWTNNNMIVSLYQEGQEVYPYSSGTVSQSDGSVIWYNVTPGTYDIYASKDSEHISTLVDTGQDIVVSE